MKPSEYDDAVPTSVGTYPVPAEALARVLDELAVEPVVPS
jgi:hypothetical protein